MNKTSNHRPALAVALLTAVALASVPAPARSNDCPTFEYQSVRCWEVVQEDSVVITRFTADEELTKLLTRESEDVLVVARSQDIPTGCRLIGSARLSKEQGANPDFDRIARTVYHMGGNLVLVSSERNTVFAPTYFCPQLFSAGFKKEGSPR